MKKLDNILITGANGWLGRRLVRRLLQTCPDAKIRCLVLPGQDADWLKAHVTALSAHHESPRPEPWAVSDAPASYIDGLVRAIVGFELTIQAIEGKYKLSQNRPEADQQGVRDAFAREGRDDIARLMK